MKVLFSLLFFVILISEGFSFSLSFPSITLSTNKRSLLAFHAHDINLSNEISHGSLGPPDCIEYAKHLKLTKPNYFLSLSNIFLICSVYSVFLNFFNKSKVYRKDALYHQIFHRPKGKGLLTVSNHQSLLDDPGIWSISIPWWRTFPNQMRWTLCTHDMFFKHPLVTWICRFGNTIPLDRKASRDQPLFEVFHEKLKLGKWCHIFPEGRIWQSWRFDSNQQVLGPIKTGMGKLIAHCYPNDPIVLPIYHKGFDKIIPEVELDKNSKDPAKEKSLIPLSGQSVEVFIGKPLQFHDKIKQFLEKYPNALNKWYSTKESTILYREIAEEIKIQLLELEKEAYIR